MIWLSRPRWLTQRLTVDFLMVVFLIYATSSRAYGGNFHEWAGVACLACVAIHVWLNRNFFRSLVSGTWSFRRSLNTAIIAVIILNGSLFLLTGLMMSKEVLAFLSLKGSMTLRNAHATLAYWALPLIGIHLGTQWRRVARTGPKGPGRTRVWFLKITILIGMVIFGIRSFLGREMPQKLFLGRSFDYWDPDKPAFFLCLSYVSIIILFTILAYFLDRLWRKQ
ncbi:MAG: DUF4405 domain-containing protein [Deltaproteobacteria bacterium]|jgi:hypothetical protein|nr:DUF4405 domain-containing protein [Deltaproteobacteria bacterium]